MQQACIGTMYSTFVNHYIFYIYKVFYNVFNASACKRWDMENIIEGIYMIHIVVVPHVCVCVWGGGLLGKAVQLIICDRTAADGAVISPLPFFLLVIHI